MVSGFARDESGAVAVDWVVLSAGLVGLGMAAVMVVSNGIESLAGDIAGHTAAIEIPEGFARMARALTHGMDFSDGPAGWSGGTVVDLIGFGEVLQIGPGATAGTSFAVPEGATSATITFDLIGIDDLSGPDATIFVNGQAVAIYSDNHGNISTSDMGVAGVTVEVSQHYTNSAMGAGSHGHDSRATYTIMVNDPGTSVTFGVQNGSDRPVSEEFYALDDVSFNAS